MSRKYSILLFDADDTLFDFQQAEKNALTQLLTDVDLPMNGEVLRLYRHINEGLWRQHEAGTVTKEELQATRFMRLFEHFDASVIVDGIAANKRYLSYLAEQSCLLPEALSICRALKKHHQLYLVTNGISQVQRQRLEKSPLQNVMDGIFVSEDTGSQKPQQAFFNYVFARIPNFSREKTLIIGDSLTSDIQGGLHAGIDTCWLNPQRLPGRDNVIPTYEIASLNQLFQLLHEDQ